VKPFPLEELVMRIRAITKRNETSSIYRFQGIEVLADESRIIKDHADIKLPHKEFLIIMYLVQQQ
jgi:DNA-binding response OmpR family regulator